VGRWKEIRVSKTDSIDFPTIVGLNVLRLVKNGYRRFEIFYEPGDRPVLVIRALRQKEKEKKEGGG